jgi:hypothetical protein
MHAHAAAGAQLSGLLAAVASWRWQPAPARQPKAVQTGPSAACGSLAACPLPAVRTQAMVGADANPSLRPRGLSLAAAPARDMHILCYRSDRLGFLPQAGCPSRCCMFLAVNRVPVVAAVALPVTRQHALAIHRHARCLSARVRGLEDSKMCAALFHRTVRYGPPSLDGHSAKSSFDIRCRRRIDVGLSRR